MTDAGASAGSSPAELVCSVVIPTFGPPTSLERTLSLLGEQSIPRRAYEIIVADNNTSPELTAAVRDVAERAGCRFVHAPERGAGAARNAGVLAAKAPVVVFVDDDMIVGPRFLESHLDRHRGRARIAVVGPIVPRQRQGGIFHTYLTRRVAINRTPDPNDVDFRHFYGANSSVDRDSLLEVGLFDTDFVRRQDGELAYRLREAGVTFVVAPDARGEHDPSIDLLPYLRRCRRDGYYLAMLAHRHPGIESTENLARYRGWMPIVAAPASVALVLIGSVLRPITPSVLFRGFTAAALAQSGRGFRAFERERARR